MYKYNRVYLINIYCIYIYSYYYYIFGSRVATGVKFRPVVTVCSARLK